LVKISYHKIAFKQRGKRKYFADYARLYFLCLIAFYRIFVSSFLQFAVYGLYIFHRALFFFRRIRFQRLPPLVFLNCAMRFSLLPSLVFNEILIIQNPHIVDFRVGFCRKRILK